jgi:hypothetical protein
MKRKYSRLREAAYEDGAASFQSLATDPTFRDFVCLYLAEGCKRDRNAVSICNSDPAVMLLARRWVANLTQKPIAYRLQYHADQNIEKLRAFWGATLNVDPSCIRVQRKSNSGQLAGRSWRSRYGVLALYIGDTLLRARLQAWMDAIRDEWR